MIHSFLKKKAFPFFVLGLFLLSFASYAQVLPGTATPDPSAILELNSSNKGFLGPRVALTSQIDQVTIAAPAEGLLVYNLGTAGLKYKGYVFWSGTEWRSFDNSSISEGVLGGITCNSITLTPNTYAVGVPYTGTLIVPYIGGNGGVYASQTVGPVNGLTATLTAGNFKIGAGSLVYTIAGTPTASSPTVTTFTITLGGVSCSATVGEGAGVTIDPGELLFYQTTLDASTSNVWLSSSASDLPIIGGKLRLDAYFYASSNTSAGTLSMRPRLVNVSASPVKLWFSALTTINYYNAGNYLMAAGGYVELDDQIYYGTGYNDILGTTTPRATGTGNSNHQEIVQVDLSLDDKWYRIYYFPIVDNMNTAATADNLRKIYLSIQRLY